MLWAGGYESSLPLAAVGRLLAPVREVRIGGGAPGELARTIGLFQLSMFGIGATIGTGIFIVFTQAVPIGGPAVILSFVFAGTVAGLTAIGIASIQTMEGLAMLRLEGLIDWKLQAAVIDRVLRLPAS